MIIPQREEERGGEALSEKDDSDGEGLLDDLEDDDYNISTVIQKRTYLLKDSNIRFNHGIMVVHPSFFPENLSWKKHQLEVVWLGSSPCQE